MIPEKNPTILYMDDDSDDLQMLEDALQSIDSSFQLVKAIDGHDGLEKLKRMKESGNLPCLIVLDLNMPKLNGLETFQRIKNDEVLSSIPAVIFSTSNNPRDRTYFDDENVEYITKPIQYSILLEVAKRLLSYCTT